MKFNVNKLDGQFLKGLKILSEEYGFSFSDDGILITAESWEEDGFFLVCKDGKACIKYSEKVLFFTAFSHLMQRFGEEFSLQKTRLKRLGVMRDCARNGILSEQGFYKVIPYFALMGYNYFELYGEDLYELEEYPYLGINRGRYTAEEIRRMDDYAAVFGVELTPCIQTLAHLPCALRRDAFQEILDIDDVLLIDDEKTYAFLDALIGFCAKNFRSKNINLGMDEAHRMGLGKYLEKHQYTKDRSKMFLSHLKRVLEICRKYGFAPAMWSDMIFKVALDIHVDASYVEMEGKTVSPEFIADFPKDVKLIFWDYYHTEKEFYDNVLKRHFQITDNVAFAGGAWTWVGLAPFNTKAQNILDYSIAGCKENGCQDFFLTAWGDNGGECLLMPAMSSFLYAAEKWFGLASEEDLDGRAQTIFGYSFLDLKGIEKINAMSKNYMEETKADQYTRNIATYLLYNDPLCGLLDAHAYEGQKEMFRQNAQFLRDLAMKKGKMSPYFSYMSLLGECLEVKATLGKECYTAYQAGDKEELKRLAEQVIPDCCARLARFTEAYCDAWLLENKSFGLEVQQLRYGMLKKRLQTAQDRIFEYLSGKKKSIEEYEQDRLPVCSFMQEGENIGFNYFAWNVSGSLL